MKKNRIALVFLFLFCLIRTPLAPAATFDLNETVATGEISANTDWTLAFDLSAINAYDLGIRSLYVEIVLKLVTGTCTDPGNDTAVFGLRPFDDDINRRYFSIVFTDSVIGGYDYYSNFVWLPIGSDNKFEYSAFSMDCQDSKIEYTISIRGYTLENN